jgi:uncharacterized protein GlcG (DUF336 family)
VINKKYKKIFAKAVLLCRNHVIISNMDKGGSAYLLARMMQGPPLFLQASMNKSWNCIKHGMVGAAILPQVIRLLSSN